MRKYKLISITGLVVILLLATAVYSFIERRQQTQSRAYNVSAQQKAQQLDEWQKKVNDWHQQEAQKKMTDSRAGSGVEGTSTLPDTGPGDMLGIVLAITLLSTVSHLAINKFIFKRA